MSLLLFHQVIDAMDFAVYAYDVEHVIVDNLQVRQSVPFDFAVRLFSPCPPPARYLQFMLSRVGRKNGGGAFGDRFDQQDLAIEKFRRFATDVRTDAKIFYADHIPRKPPSCRMLISMV
jgi:twinkle protein